MASFASILFLLFSYTLLAFAFYSLSRSLRLKMRGVRTIATIVSIEVRRGDGDDSTPLYEFTTGDGQRFRFNGTTKGRINSYRLGDTNAILYDPENPKLAKEASFYGLYVIGLSLFLLGVCFLTVGIVLASAD